MGLATIDPQSHMVIVQTKLYKILKFGVQRPKIKPFENAKICKEMYGHPDPDAGRRPNTASGWPYISLLSQN